MGDGMKVDDTGEELVLLVGRRGPISDLLEDLRITSLYVIKAGSVD